MTITSVNFSYAESQSYRTVQQWRTGGGGLGVQTPSEIPKALQNHAKLNPTVKTVKKCWS